jgi:hypothetical protein
MEYIGNTGLSTIPLFLKNYHFKIKLIQMKLNIEWFWCR